MTDDVISLISETETRDAYGVWIPAGTKTEKLCRVESITRQEFYNAGRNGLNPSFKFIIFAGDYNGETACEYRGNRYSIYRTYTQPDSDDLELYVERKGGTNGTRSEEALDGQETDPTD